MSKTRTQSDIERPIPYMGKMIDISTFLRFSVGHDLYRHLTPEKRLIIDREISSIIEEYKNKNLGSADKRLDDIFRNFVSSESVVSSIEGLDFEGKAGLFLSTLTRNYLMQGLDPRMLHDARLLKLYPLGYFTRCATYLLLTQEEPQHHALKFALTLPQEQLKLVFEYTDFFDTNFSKRLMESGNS